MNHKWYVYVEGQQLGPYSEDLLRQFVTENRILPDTLLWSEGMAEWQRADSLLDLFPYTEAIPTLEPMVAVAPSPASSWAPPGARVPGALASQRSATTSPYAAPTSALMAPPGGAYPYLTVKPVNYGLFLGSFLGAILLLILGAITLWKEQVPVGIALGVLGALCIMTHNIFSYINIYEHGFTSSQVLREQVRVRQLDICLFRSSTSTGYS